MHTSAIVEPSELSRARRQHSRLITFTEPAN